MWFLINNVNFNKEKDKALHFGQKKNQKNQMFDCAPGNNCLENNPAVNNLKCLAFPQQNNYKPR